MSRSKPTTQIISPIARYYDWDGGRDPENDVGGCVYYYDKEKKEKVRLPRPFKFLLLDDERFSVSGYNEDQKLTYYSNEVKKAKDHIKIYAQQDGRKIDIEEGTWESLKDGKYYRYTKHLYIAHNNGEGYEICMLRVTGGSFGAWLDFSKKVKRFEVGISITDREKGQKGSVKFYTPVFSTFEITPEEDEQAIELDVKLQAYFDEREAKYGKKEEKESSPPDRIEDSYKNVDVSDVEEELADEEIPF